MINAQLLLEYIGRKQLIEVVLNEDEVWRFRWTPNAEEVIDNYLDEHLGQYCINCRHRGYSPSDASINCHYYPPEDGRFQSTSEHAHCSFFEYGDL